MNEFSQYFPARIRKLAEIADSKPLKQAVDSANPIALNLNENPFGPSPRALDAMRKAQSEVHRYPEINATDLHDEIARFHKVQANQVLVGAGASELLCIIARALLAPGLNALTSAKSFIVYKLATQVTEGTLIEIPPVENGYDLRSIARAIDGDTRIIFIANPNNPTGTLITPDEMDGFVEHLPEHVLLVLDEAYGDYAEYFAKQRKAVYSRALDYIAQGRAVILLKTFSKAHGLAGLRVGYAIGSAELIALFKQLRTVFSISSVAQAAAAAALYDASHIRHAVENNAGQAECLTKELSKLGIPVPQIWANFLYLELDRDAVAFSDRMRTHGIVVQPLSLWGAPNAIRVSIGTPEQNQRFLLAMRAVNKK